MPMFKYELHGVEIHTTKGHYPLAAWFEADTESDAIAACSRISQAIAVSHGMTIYRCVGIVPTSVVLNRNACEPKTAW